MQEIQINESAPRHTKALVAISLVVIIILAFTLAYIFLFSSGKSSNQTLNTGAFNTIFSEQVNATQQSDETLPQVVRGFLGKWQGVWTFSDKQQLPVGLVVGSVTQTGWSITYANTALPSEKIEAIKGRTTATPILLKEGDENIPALQITLPGYKGEGVVTMVFWLSETADTLFGRFTDPVTQEVVTGEFKRLP
jgi:hypothetical protein